ncbi:hypothetical protein HDV05_002648, partial [Chytridiales sp. JEL 0842]
ILTLPGDQSEGKPMDMPVMTRQQLKRKVGSSTTAAIPPTIGLSSSSAAVPSIPMFGSGSLASSTPFTFNHPGPSAQKDQGVTSKPLFAAHQPFLQNPFPTSSEPQTLKSNTFSAFSAPLPSAQRAPSPTRKTYEDLAEFFAKKGDQPLTAEEASRIQGLLKAHVDDSKTTSSTSSTSLFASSTAMRVSDLGTSTTVKRPLFAPVHPFGPPSASSTITRTNFPRQQQARRRPTTFFGASYGPNGNPYKPIRQPQKSVVVDKEEMDREEPKAKRQRVGELEVLPP